MVYPAYDTTCVRNLALRLRIPYACAYAPTSNEINRDDHEGHNTVKPCLPGYTLTSVVCMESA